MSDEEKDEFEEFEMRGDDAGALMWLEQRYPDYRSIVREEYTIVLTRLAASAGWMGSVIDLPS
ncbi:hypothetical protein C8N24_0270 [Solirubrobacter pauli]|uniref:Uncharacterized protein n=2 Tax=Solirubrobacter pauli TaxID=166793 RepID=A0A660L7X5_9ACTN|nr:hypothetical protein C8N24_0270 [Solirubrobacter pauli]